MRSTLVVSTESSACAHSAPTGPLLLALVLIAACGSPTSTTPPAETNVLALVSGDGQHARLTRELPQPIIVIARNSTGSAVSGVGITFTTSSGSVSTSAATSDGAGQASVRWTLGSTAGAQTLTVRLASGTGTPLTINATADPAVVVSIQVFDGDRQQAVVGTALGVAPSVVVRDAQGALASSLGVRFTVTAGGGTVGSAVVTTDANGRASAGAWTLGSVAGSNALSLTPADADVVAAAPLLFSAVGVAPGGVTSSPMRSYILNSSSATTVQDSVTGQAFRFPAGAHGTLDVARVLSGPVPPWFGATRFRATFSGPEVLEFVTVKPAGGEAQAFMYSDTFGPVSDNYESPRWWGVPRSRVVGDSVFFLLPSGLQGYLAWAGARPATRSLARGATWAAAVFLPADLVTPAVQAYAVVPIATTAGFTALGRYREALQQAIDWWLGNLPTDDSFRASFAIAAHNPYTVTIGERATPEDDRSYYLPIGATPTFFFDTVNAIYRERSTRHEAGHYISHMMLGDAAYRTLAANGPAGKHDPGEIARGVRGSLTEEYAYAGQFFMSGNLDNIDLRSLGATGPLTGMGFLIYPETPKTVDSPSLEGFGAAMLAALTRRGTDTLLYDFSANYSRSRSPALGVSVSTVLGILAKGPQNPNQLRSMILPLAGSEEMLAVLLEPIGWSYWGFGRLIDGTGSPIAGATVRSVVKVNGIEYLTPLSTELTTTNGIFTLARLYPGTSALRVYIQNPTGYGSTDAMTVTVPWETTTNAPQPFGDVVVPGMPAYNDINVWLSGFISPNTLGTSTCKPNFGMMNSLATSNTASAFYPLWWNGNRFSVSGSTSFSGTAASGFPFTATESMSISGTITVMRTDSIWVTLTGSQSHRIEELVPGPPVAWQLTVQDAITFSLGSMALESNGSTPATYRGTLHGTAAALTMLSANPSYFNQSTITPTFLPQSCHGYSVNPANADIQVTLRIRP